MFEDLRRNHTDRLFKNLPKAFLKKYLMSFFFLFFFPDKRIALPNRKAPFYWRVKILPFVVDVSFFDFLFVDKKKRFLFLKPI